MNADRSNYVGRSTDTLERRCDHCEWFVVGDSHAGLVAQYQDHLRESHPTVWLRS